MGDVYEARTLKDAQTVAIKVLREDLIKDKEATARFAREAHAAAALRSQHAARIFEVGQAQSGQPFIVMEYLHGQDLMAEIDTRGSIPVEEAVSYVVQACHAMIEAHDKGIVHRDLKPPNLFLAEERGRRVVKVLDFGISKMTRLNDGHVTSTQMSFGSPLYMSPEQIRSTKLVDARSDVWSLGVILYEAIVGEPPFIAETPGALAVVISVEAHVPPSQKRPGLPPALDEIIGHALQKNPAKRYQSVKAFSMALEGLLANLSNVKRISTEPSPPAIAQQAHPATPQRANDVAGVPRMGSDAWRGSGATPRIAQPQQVQQAQLQLQPQQQAQLQQQPQQQPQQVQQAQQPQQSQQAQQPQQSQQQQPRGPLPSFSNEGSYPGGGGVAAAPSPSVRNAPQSAPQPSAAVQARMAAPVVHESSAARGRTIPMPRELPLPPSSTNRNAQQKKARDNIAWIVAGALIPLGLLAFGFAIWLFARDTKPSGAPDVPSTATEPAPTASAPEATSAPTSANATSSTSSRSAPESATPSAAVSTSASARSVRGTKPKQPYIPERP
ncbi:MAG: serine/threonine-protein kinase [Polyangiaceae bacterium]